MEEVGRDIRRFSISTVLKVSDRHNLYEKLKREKRRSYFSRPYWSHVCNQQPQNNNIMDYIYMLCYLGVVLYVALPNSKLLNQCYLTFHNRQCKLIVSLLFIHNYFFPLLS